jgi:hypothetical protein
LLLLLLLLFLQVMLLLLLQAMLLRLLRLPRRRKRGAAEPGRDRRVADDRAPHGGVRRDGARVALRGAARHKLHGRGAPARALGRRKHNDVAVFIAVEIGDPGPLGAHRIARPGRIGVPRRLGRVVMSLLNRVVLSLLNRVVLSLLNRVVLSLLNRVVLSLLGSPLLVLLRRSDRRRGADHKVVANVTVGVAVVGHAAEPRAPEQLVLKAPPQGFAPARGRRRGAG